jgi:hypothetical protein
MYCPSLMIFLIGKKRQLVDNKTTLILPQSYQKRATNSPVYVRKNQNPHDTEEPNDTNPTPLHQKKFRLSQTLFRHSRVFVAPVD